MIRLFTLLAVCALPTLSAQDLGEGLRLNDLELRPVQDVPKPAYLESFADPSFGTTIRRISDAGAGNAIVPMYSTVQAWNADESRMILLNQTRDRHLLLNGTTYAFIRQLDDVRPADVKQIFWDFDDADSIELRDLNENGGEHSGMGKMADGTDAYFTISFAQVPDGGYLGDIACGVTISTARCSRVISFT